MLIAKENNGAITTADLSEKRIRRGNQNTCRRWEIKNFFLMRKYYFIGLNESDSK